MWNIELCTPLHSVPPAHPAAFGIEQSDPASQKPWSSQGRISWMDPPQGCPLLLPAAAYRPPWSHLAEPLVSDLQPLQCSQSCLAWTQGEVVELQEAVVCHRSWNGEVEVGVEGQRRQLNVRWVVEGHCCCWRGCCWRENHNFGWSLGVEAGVEKIEKKKY